MRNVWACVSVGKASFDLHVVVLRARQQARGAEGSVMAREGKEGGGELCEESERSERAGSSQARGEERGGRRGEACLYPTLPNTKGWMLGGGRRSVFVFGSGGSEPVSPAAATNPTINQGSSGRFPRESHARPFPSSVNLKHSPSSLLTINKLCPNATDNTAARLGLPDPSFLTI